MDRGFVWLQLGLTGNDILVIIVVLAVAILAIGILVPTVRRLRRQRRERRAIEQDVSINCPRCGTLTSTAEDACPSCGKNLT